MDKADASVKARQSKDYKLKLNFIRKDIPDFEVPEYKGQRYKALAPDTLDIQERINLAVNGLTGPTDPDKDYLIYFGVYFRTNPPNMVHNSSDICQAKFMEALPLMRVASGSNLNDNVDPVWIKVALSAIGPDGLAYWPSLPWTKAPSWSIPLEGADQYAMPFFCGRLLSAITAYMLHDPSGPWKEEGRKIVDGLWSVTIDRGDYAYFPIGSFSPGYPRVKDADMPMGIHSSLVGWTMQGLAKYYQATDYKPAKELAGKLARYLAFKGEYFGPNGEFLPNDLTSKSIHFQHHMVPLLGLLDYALAANDKEIVDFVNKSYLWARTKGNTLVGYFPENIDNIEELETSETCEVAGMIGVALKLSAAGAGDYWDDADRWIRNQFAEN